MRPVDIARRITTRRLSARTEVHWVPRSNENGAGLEQQHAVTSRELGERDWAAIDPVQVRTSKGVRHYFTGALYFWERTLSHVWCESQAEGWEVLWLDYGGQVSPESVSGFITTFWGFLDANEEAVAMAKHNTIPQLKASEGFSGAVGLAVLKTVSESQEIQSYMTDPAFLGQITEIAADALHAEHRPSKGDVTAMAAET